MFYNGNPVTTIAAWEQRRAQLKDLMHTNVYGYMPAPPRWEAKIIKEVLLPEHNALYKEVTIQLYRGSTPTVQIRLSVFVPDTKQPVPVVIAINKCGNPEVISDTSITRYSDRVLHSYCEKEVKKHGGDEESMRGMKTDFWALDTLLKRGYAFATFHESDVAPDVSNLEQGIFPFYPELQSDTGWGVIAAWAWGLQRAVDYLITDRHIDSSRIILFGHSRRGKAALLAAALHERVAMVVPHQSGTGGMALSKKHPLESVAQINRMFPCWFNARFKSYSGRVKKLPVDQHYLLALMAPRPVIETVGTKDIWSSYWLSLKTLRAVSPVYELYGMQGLAGTGKVKARGTFKTANLVQVRRPYMHTMNGDYWHYILDFADLKLNRLK